MMIFAAAAINAEHAESAATTHLRSRPPATAPRRRHMLSIWWGGLYGVRHTAGDLFRGEAGEKDAVSF